MTRKKRFMKCANIGIPSDGDDGGAGDHAAGCDSRTGQAPCDRPQNQAGTDEIDPNQISSTRKIPSMDSIAARASWRLISLGSTTERLMAMEPFVTGEVWMI